MPLKLSLASRALVWAEVVHSRGQRVFVPCPDNRQLGDEVLVEVQCVELQAPVLVSGTVVGLRPAVGHYPAGLQVNLDEGSVKRCEAAVGAAKDEDVRVVGRTEPRVDCSFPARLLTPSVVEGCLARNLSAHGLTLYVPTGLEKDVTVAVQLNLPEGEAVFSAQVMWARPELKLVGLRVTVIDSETAQRLVSAVSALLRGSPSAQAEGPIVVTADDDPSILEMLSRMLSKLGLRVFRAERGDVALALVRSERPALVLLDVLMPGLDGLEVCKAIRADATLAHTPVVLLSAMGEKRLAEAAPRVGANDFLTKPLRLDALRALVLKHLGSAHAKALPPSGAQ